MREHDSDKYPMSYGIRYKSIQNAILYGVCGIPSDNV